MPILVDRDLAKRFFIGVPLRIGQPHRDVRAVKLHFSYRRFLENQIREAFGFMGSLIWIKNRARE